MDPDMPKISTVKNWKRFIGSLRRNRNVIDRRKPVLMKISGKS